MDCRIHVPAGEADERGRVLLCEILENTVMGGGGAGQGIGRGTRKLGAVDALILLVMVAAAQGGRMSEALTLRSVIVCKTSCAFSQGPRVLGAQGTQRPCSCRPAEQTRWQLPSSSEMGMINPAVHRGVPLTFLMFEYTNELRILKVKSSRLLREREALSEAAWGRSAMFSYTHSASLWFLPMNSITILFSVGLKTEDRNQSPLLLMLFQGSRTLPSCS